MPTAYLFALMKVRGKKLSLDRVEKWARSNPALVLLAIMLVVISSLVTIFDGGTKLREMYVKTFGSNEAKYAKLRTLATETQIDFFSSALGAPAFKNRQSNYVEHIFIDSQFYVQAITDEDGKVLMFSVTTRSKSFNPTLDLGELEVDGQPFVVTLGKTKFSDLDDIPRKIEAYTWNRGMSYREKYYFGNPGLYQNFDFVSCEAGYRPEINIHLGEFVLAAQEGIEIKSLATNVAEFRRACVINTYTITAPLLDVDDEISELGPSYDQVRLIKEINR